MYFTGSTEIEKALIYYEKFCYDQIGSKKDSREFSRISKASPIDEQEFLESEEFQELFQYFLKHKGIEIEEEQPDEHDIVSRQIDEIEVFGEVEPFNCDEDMLLHANTNYDIDDYIPGYSHTGNR